MKQKAKTNLEKLGFLDEDRNKTHDDLQIEILKNPKKILLNIFKNKNWIKNEIKINDIKLEYPLVNRNVNSNYKSIIGYIDVLIFFTISINESQKKEGILAIEIKTKIDNFGDVIRQVNTYKEYESKFLYCIASPDDNFCEFIKTQNIYFYDFT